MRDTLLSSSIVKQILNFANFYHNYKVKTENLRSVKYRMVSTLDEFKKTNLIQLSFLDNPGDILAPLPIETIKTTADILAGMHPIDINTINDLYYLSQDRVASLQVERDLIIALKTNGESVTYKISDTFDPDSADSTRLAYMMGYMQAEKFIKDAFSVPHEKYKITKDNISTLEILDLKSNKCFLKNPLDLLYSNDYKHFSKKDVAHIGYICGQMSRM